MPAKPNLLDASLTGPNLREEAARQIFERYVVRLKSLVRACLDARIRQREGTSDLVQSALKSLFKRSHNFRDPDSLWPLLITITLNKARSAATRHLTQKRNFRVESSFSSEELDQLAAPPTLHEAHEVLDLVRCFLEKLNEVDQRVIWLRLEGKTYDEIASELSTSCAAVKMRHGRALERLRRIMDGGPKE